MKSNRIIFWRRAKESGSFKAGKSEFQGRKVGVSSKESRSFKAGKSN